MVTNKMMKSKSPPRNDSLLPNIYEITKNKKGSMFNTNKLGNSIEPTARSDGRSDPINTYYNHSNRTLRSTNASSIAVNNN
jgi:hypothetical protein